MKTCCRCQCKRRGPCPDDCKGTLCPFCVKKVEAAYNPDNPAAMAVCMERSARRLMEFIVLHAPKSIIERERRILTERLAALEAALRRN